MEKYTTGTRPLRRQSGCKEEENPYSATCADSFTDATFRRVVYQERRSRRPFANRNKHSCPMHSSFLFRHHCNPSQPFLLCLRRSIEQGSSFDKLKARRV